MSQGKTGMILSQKARFVGVTQKTASLLSPVSPDGKPKGAKSMGKEDSRVRRDLQDFRILGRIVHLVNLVSVVFYMHFVGVNRKKLFMRHMHHPKEEGEEGKWRRRFTVHVLWFAVSYPRASAFICG
jgi:hypothetical protein